MDLEQGIKASLIASPVCTLSSATKQLGLPEKSEVQVDGVIRLVVPTVLEQQMTTIETAKDEETLARSELIVEDKTVPSFGRPQTKSSITTESMVHADMPQQRKGLLPSYTELPSIEPLSKATVTRAGPLPNSSKPSPAALQRTPFFPRGAESIPPMIWTMPERG